MGLLSAESADSALLFRLNVVDFTALRGLEPADAMLVGGEVVVGDGGSEVLSGVAGIDAATGPLATILRI